MSGDWEVLLLKVKALFRLSSTLPRKRTAF
jgi:hypothetical protein